MKLNKVNINNNYENKYIKFITKFRTEDVNLDGISNEFRNNMVIKTLTYLIRYLNQRCGADTVINYRILPVETETEYKNNQKIYKLIIKFPIQQHKIDSNDDLVLKNIKIISDYIKNKKWELDNKQYLWLWRTLYQLKYKPESYIMYDDYKEKVEWGISVDAIKKYEIKIRQTILKDGTKLKEILDPLINDYGLYINLSVPFSDMDYGYNYLHFYEHIMTYAWKSLSQQNVLELNGGTTCNAICYVYNIHSNSKSMEEYLKEYIDFHLKSRRNDFWKKEIVKGLETELERTTSETLMEKSLSQMAKTDPYSQHAYNTQILQYYSNKPFEIIVYSPKITNAKKICEQYFNNSEELQKITPKKIKFDYYPLHVLRDKKDRNYLVLHINKKMENGVTGIDNYIHSDSDINELNTTLLKILLKDGIDLKSCLINEPTPFSNLNINYTSTSLSDVSGYFLNSSEFF